MYACMYVCMHVVLCMYRVRHKDLPMTKKYPVTSFFKLETPNFAECLLHVYFVILPNLKRLLASVA